MCRTTFAPELEKIYYPSPPLLPLLRKKEALKISSSSSSEEEEEASTEGIFLWRVKNYNLNNSKKILNSLSESRLIAIVFEIIQFIKLKLLSRRTQRIYVLTRIYRFETKSGLSGIVFAKFAEQLGNYYLDSKVVGSIRYTRPISQTFRKKFPPAPGWFSRGCISRNLSLNRVFNFTSKRRSGAATLSAGMHSGVPGGRSARSMNFKQLPRISRRRYADHHVPRGY